MRFLQFVVSLVILLPAYVHSTFTYNCDNLYSGILPYGIDNSKVLNGTWYQVQLYGEDSGSPVCEALRITPGPNGKTFKSSASLTYNNGTREFVNDNYTFQSTGEALAQVDSINGVPTKSINSKKVVFVAVDPQLYYITFSCVNSTPQIVVRTRAEFPTEDTWGEIYTIVSTDFSLDTLWFNKNCQAPPPINFPISQFRSSINPWSIFF